jgi:hypothetical protein
MTRTVLRCLTVLLVLLLVVPSVALAEEGYAQNQGLLAGAWQALLSLVSKVEALGPGLDPAGQPPGQGNTSGEPFHEELGPTMGPGGMPHT